MDLYKNKYGHYTRTTIYICFAYLADLSVAIVSGKKCANCVSTACQQSLQGSPCMHACINMDILQQGVQ